jgi:ferrous iron transport protein A
MPLTMLNAGEIGRIKKVGGSSETKRFMENLGFVTGEEVTVVSSFGNNLIVNIKDSRVAINSDMAMKIII